MPILVFLFALFVLFFPAFPIASAFFLSHNPCNCPPSITSKCSHALMLSKRFARAASLHRISTNKGRKANFLAGDQRWSRDERDLDELFKHFKLGGGFSKEAIEIRYNPIGGKKLNSGRIYNKNEWESTESAEDDEAELMVEVSGESNSDGKFRKRDNLNPKCNSLVLRKLMMDNMNDNPTESKRAINLAAEHHFGGDVNVICSRGQFSYIYTSSLFCELSNGLVACIAFRQSL